MTSLQTHVYECLQLPQQPVNSQQLDNSANSEEIATCNILHHGGIKNMSKKGVARDLMKLTQLTPTYNLVMTAPCMLHEYTTS